MCFIFYTCNKINPDVFILFLCQVIHICWASVCVCSLGCYLAVVLSLILQHLLQVEAAGQVALSQVVAELGDTQKALLGHHGVAANGTTGRANVSCNVKREASHWESSTAQCVSE